MVMSISVIDIILIMSPIFLKSSNSWTIFIIQLIDIFINCIQREEDLDNSDTKF